MVFEKNWGGGGGLESLWRGLNFGLETLLDGWILWRCVALEFVGRVNIVEVCCTCVPRTCRRWRLARRTATKSGRRCWSGGRLTTQWMSPSCSPPSAPPPTWGLPPRAACPSRAPSALATLRSPATPSSRCSPSARRTAAPAQATAKRGSGKMIDAILAACSCLGCGQVGLTHCKQVGLTCTVRRLDWLVSWGENYAQYCEPCPFKVGVMWCVYLRVWCGHWNEVAVVIYYLLVPPSTAERLCLATKEVFLSFMQN